jgi:hypothetical protein
MVRADQHVFPQVKILLDVVNAAPLNPSQVGFHRPDCAPPLLTPPVEKDVHPLAAPECLLQGTVQVQMVPRHDQQALRRSSRRRCLRPTPGDRHLFSRPS